MSGLLSTPGAIEFLAAMARARTRTQWNERLVHWGRPASEHEEENIQRAARMAAQIVGGNRWLLGEGVTIQAQGSYYNNTNVRIEADMDLRIQHPSIKIYYLNVTDWNAAFAQLGYSKLVRNLETTANLIRDQAAAAFVGAFGQAGVDTAGNKAIRVHGLEGSRAPCDIVPAFRLDVIVPGAFAAHVAFQGVAIAGRDGSWIYNFPEQHHANGVAKRERTAHRFKKCVRMLKQLNYELEEMGMIPRRVPSFFIECLAYRVPNPGFLVEEDDSYDRLRRIVYQMAQQLADQNWAIAAMEISECKKLFDPGQAWTLAQAQQFAAAAAARLDA